MFKQISYNFFLIFLLSISDLFSATIALITTKDHPYSNCIMHADDLIKKFQEMGHTITFLPLAQGTNNNLDSYDLIVGIQTNFIKDLDLKKMIYYQFEPAVIVPNNLSMDYLSKFHKVFTWNHDICDGVKFHKGFYAACENLHPEFIPFQDRKFACLINSYLIPSGYVNEALYEARKKVAAFYNRYFPKSLTFHGGRGWQKFKFSNFKGNCKDKHEVLRNHKFNYCYENWDNNYHYISEKILDCFSNRCVPIYLGSSRITDYIPENTFIDARNFSSIAKIHKYISTMSEEKWLSYITAIEDFLASENSRYFKKESFIEDLSREMLKSLEEFKAL